MVRGTTWIFVYKEVANLRSQTDWNIAQMLLFLDNLLIFYQAFSVNLTFNRCGMFVAGGGCTFIRDCASIRTYTVIA